MVCTELAISYQRLIAKTWRREPSCWLGARTLTVYGSVAEGSDGGFEQGQDSLLYNAR